MKIRPAETNDLSKALPVAETIAALRARAEAAEKARDLNLAIAETNKRMLTDERSAHTLTEMRAEAAEAALKRVYTIITRRLAEPDNDSDTGSLVEAVTIIEGPIFPGHNWECRKEGYHQVLDELRKVFREHASPGPVDATRTGRDPYCEMHHYHMPDGHCTCKPERRTGKDRRAAPSSDTLRDTTRLNWLESVTTLHTAPVFLYVVDSYEVSIERDGNEAPVIYKGDDFRSAIDAALEAKGR